MIPMLTKETNKTLSMGSTLRTVSKLEVEAAEFGELLREMTSL